MARPDPTREGIGRRLATMRAWATATTLLPAIGLVPHGGLPLLLVAMVVEGVLAAMTWRVAHSVRDGTEGDLLYVSGGRIPSAWLQNQRRLEQTALLLSALGMLGLATLATPWTLILAALCLVLWVTVFLALRIQWRATRLLLLLHDHKPAEALALSERWRKGRFGSLLGNLHVTALLMSRRIDEARELRAQAWNGAIDRGALGIALDRVQSGDPQLARQLIEGVRGDDRYARYLRELLKGHVALVVEDPTVRLDPSLLALLPDAMANELRMVDAALARQRGDAALAAERLGPIDLDVEGWRAAAYPRLWVALGRTPAPSVSAPREHTEGDAFAPPSEAAEGERARWAVVGAQPLTKAAVTTPWRPTLQEALVLLATLLLAIASLLFTMSLTGRLLGESPLPGGLELSSFGLGIAVFILFRYGAVRAASRGDHGILLEDGRIFDPTRPAWLYLAIGLPFFTSVLILPAALLGLAYVADLLVPVAVFTAIWVVLVWVQGVRRMRLVRMIRAIHIGSNDDLARVTAKVHHQGKAWAVLAHYMRGDLESARVAGEHALLVPDDVAALLRWDAAARGDLDVDAILRLPRPAGLGPRFVREVTLRLAALQHRPPHRVADHGGPELYLPNRIGAGLLVLDHQILVHTNPKEAKRLATRMAPELREGAWIRRCWPTLFAAPPQAPAGVEEPA